MATMQVDGSISTIRGDDIFFEVRLTENDGITPIDLTGSTIEAQVRSQPNGYLSLRFQVLQVNPFTDATYDLTNGEFGLFAAHDSTEEYPGTEGLRKEEYLWDLQHTSAGDQVTTIIGPAAFHVIRDVTLV